MLAQLAQPGCSSRTFTAFPSPADAAYDTAFLADTATSADRIPPAGQPDADASGGADLGPDAPGADAALGPDLTGPDGSTDTGPDRAGGDVRRDVATDAADGSNGPRTLFVDGFDDGYAHNWSTSESSDGPVIDSSDGTNKIAIFDSSQADYTRLRCNLDGALYTDINISASMRFRVDRAPPSTRTVRLDVRQASSTANIFYAVGATVSTDGTISQVSIFKKVSDGLGDYTECELSPGPTYSPGLALGQWRTIKISITGSIVAKLTAFLDGTAVATYTDDCASPLTATNGVMVPNGGCLVGQTGLGIQVEKGIKASVDDVLVTAP